ncbi:MAG: APC family permease [Oscillatoriophycideae cyanobacterium NC_groundwater_1537_Pr4_S-0.65um_50_18]|nr:APC family permease [Oscillatoriophycideae cyanobacterium NC_groundwater_1537_Pr4_S-0.65um_50_18]
MDTKTRSEVSILSRSGLRPECLPFSEVLAQSIANIAPTAAPALTIALVFASSGTGTWFTYLIATIGLVFVGTNINQFARRSASPGSLYAYITKGLGATAGVITGWSLILAYLFTAMAVQCGFINFVQAIFAPLGIPLAPLFLLVAGLGLAWYFAYKDVQLSAALMLILELVSVGLILLLAAIVVFKKGTVIDPAQLTLQGAQPSGIMYGLVLGVLSYVGFESATTLGEEAKAPLRTIPRAVILSTVASGLFFIVMSYVEVLGFSGMPITLGQSTAPLSDLAEAMGVGFFGILISLCAAISMFACAIACINACSRILFTMGRHGVLHRRIGRAHGRNETPHVAVTLSALLILAITGGTLLSGVAVLDSFAYFGTIATYGFLVAYILISIAAPCYLAREGRLRLRHILFSALGVLFMMIPVISSIGIPGENSLFPVPPAPYNIFPYFFLAYLAIGAGWFMYLRMKAPGVIEEMERDIEASHLRFDEMHKV